MHPSRKWRSNPSTLKYLEQRPPCTLAVYSINFNNTYLDINSKPRIIGYSFKKKIWQCYIAILVIVLFSVSHKQAEEEFDEDDEDALEFAEEEFDEPVHEQLAEEGVDDMDQEQLVQNVMDLLEDDGDEDGGNEFPFLEIFVSAHFYFSRRKRRRD